MIDGAPTTHPTMPSSFGFLLPRLALFILAATAWAADPATTEPIYSEPIPHNWVAPAYPPEAIKAKVEGRVTLGFVVDAEGRVVDPILKENKQKPVDPLLSDAVLAAAKQWTFGPALNAGKPEPRAVFITVSFYLKGRGGKPSVDLPGVPDTASTKPAKALVNADPSYPDELLARKLPGEAQFEFEITADGRTGGAKVLFASDAAFVTAGLDTLSRWTFEPARQGPLPVPSSKKSPMAFFVDGDQTKPEDVLAANGILGLAESGGGKAPEPLTMFAPVYPRARAVAGEAGTAEVEFVIGDDGRTGFVNISSASQPEFGQALQAAVETWEFRPAARNGERVAVTLRVRQAFALKEGEADARLAAEFKTGIASAKGLDRPLVPLWRISPRYPAALLAEKPVGEAVVEFVIDRMGRARLPQAVSATHEAFGWAAVTAISQWVFASPMRNGVAVDVRVSIPVNFKPPVD
jgi:TonB family protein